MKLKYRIIKIMAVFAFLLFSTNFAEAQNKSVRASQKGTISQFIANTEITIEYNRPVAKGRNLFGSSGLVKYKNIWMPGANEASNIKFNQDLLFNGSIIKAGRYSIWTIPGEKEWTVIFSKDWNQWHSEYPGKDEDVLRITTKPILGSHMEVLAFYFPNVTKSSATLNLHWGKTIVPIKIKLLN